MTALVSKNVRIARSTLVGLMLIPLLFCGGTLGPGLLAGFHWVSAPSDHATPAERLMTDFIPAALVAAFATCVALPTFAAIAVATERQERWADFKAMLPVPRRTLVLTKLGTAVGLTALVLAVNAVLCGLAYHFGSTLLDRQMAAMRVTDPSAVASWHELMARDTAVCAASFLAGTFGTFGLAWLASNLFRSTALATAAPIGGGLMLTVLMLVIPQTGVQADLLPVLLPRYDMTMLALGLAGLASGTVIALRRRGV